MTFQRNTWYAAAFPHEIDRTLKRRTLLDEPILLYRSENGDPIAIFDRCPHRFAPLSRGTLFGDVVECKYHGLRFDRSGACVLNPHADVIAPNSRVRSFPIVERHGLVWIWPGDAGLANPAAIPDLSYMTAPGRRTAHGYLHTDYRYDILVDNLLDLSHADYLHVGSFTGGACERSETHVREEGDHVIVRFSQWKAAARPNFIPLYGELVDQEIVIHWQPGQVMAYTFSVTRAGDAMANGSSYRFAHIATPETAATTHYFMSRTRDYALDDAEVDAREAAQQMAVIQGEDGPMLEAVDHEMRGQDLLDLRPVVLPTDKGGLRVRRVMKRLIERELGHAAAGTALEAAVEDTFG